MVSSDERVVRSLPTVFPKFSRFLQTYEDRLKIDRLEDRTSLCLVKNEIFRCHINIFGAAHQPTVQGSYDHSQMTSLTV